MEPCQCSFNGSAKKWTMCRNCYKNFVELVHETVNVISTGVKKARRCKSCRKKIGVLGFQCRCGDIFCGMHRYPEVHSCCKVSDYKLKGRQALANQNPICKADKLRERV